MYNICRNIYIFFSDCSPLQVISTILNIVCCAGTVGPCWLPSFKCSSVVAVVYGSYRVGHDQATYEQQQQCVYLNPKLLIYPPTFSLCYICFLSVSLLLYLIFIILILQTFWRKSNDTHYKPSDLQSLLLIKQGYLGEKTSALITQSVGVPKNHF